jgi:hypothetical protein
MHILMFECSTLTDLRRTSIIGGWWNPSSTRLTRASTISMVQPPVRPFHCCRHSPDRPLAGRHTTHHSNARASRGTALAQASDVVLKTSVSRMGVAMTCALGRGEKRAGIDTMLDDLSPDVALPSLRPAGDAELRHFGVQGTAFDSEARGGAFRPGDHPLRFLEGLQDMRAFGRLEGADPRRGTGNGPLELDQQRMKDGAGRQDDGAFDDVLEFTDISASRASWS